MTATKMNIIQKLNEASKKIGPITKDGENKFQRYTFQSEAAVKSAVEAAIREVGIRIIPEYEIVQQYDRESAKGGNNHFVDVKGTFTITDGEDSIQGTMFGSGQDTAEKAMVKAETTTQKYFYKQLFNITDRDEDPDTTNSAINAGKPKHDYGSNRKTTGNNKRSYNNQSTGNVNTNAGKLKTIGLLLANIAKLKKTSVENITTVYQKAMKGINFEHLNDKQAEEVIMLLTKQQKKIGAEQQANADPLAKALDDASAKNIQDAETAGV